MKIGIETDEHLCGKNLKACDAQLNAANEFFLSQGVELVVRCGDFHHRPSVGDSISSTGAVAEVGVNRTLQLTQEGVEVDFLLGNHDYASGQSHSLHIYAGIPKVRIYDAIAAGLHHSDEFWFAYLPWIWGNFDKYEFLEKPRDGMPNLFFAHLETSGAAMAPGQPCAPNAEHWQVTPGFLRSLPFDHYYLGHFHKRQEIVKGKGGYVGALLQQNFGEAGNPTGVEIYDTEKRVSTFHPINAAPKYVTYSITDRTEYQSISSELAGTTDKIRLRLECSTDEIPVRELTAAGVVVDEVYEATERLSRADIPQGALSDPAKLIEIWCAAQSPAIETQRVQKLQEVFSRHVSQ